MINGVYIIHRKSGGLLFEKTYEQFPIDKDLFSGLLTAIRGFLKEIHMGELTSFSTLEKKIIISLTENIVVALILDLAASTEKYQGIAYEIGHQFSQVHGVDLQEWDGNRAQFKSFNEQVGAILSNELDPFIVRVAKWAIKEFGGDIHLGQQLVTSSEMELPMNIIIDRGELKDLGFREKFLNKFHKGYNRDLIFFKVVNHLIGLNELERFIEACEDLGYECRQKERCEHYFDYFPSKIIIIAQEFSPPALEKIEELTHLNKKSNKHFIVSKHLGKSIKGAVKKGKFPMFQCQIELWKWDFPYPERIFS